MATLHIPLLEPTFPLTAAPQCSGLQWSNVGPGAVETMLPGGGASGRGGRLGSALADRALAHRALSARSAGLLPTWPADAPVPMVIAGAGASWRRVAVEELAGRSQIAVQRPPHGVKKSPVFLDAVLDHIQCLSAIDLISLVDCRTSHRLSPRPPSPSSSARRRIQRRTERGARGHTRVVSACHAASDGTK